MAQSNNVMNRKDSSTENKILEYSDKNAVYILG